MFETITSPDSLQHTDRGTRIANSLEMDKVKYLHHSLTCNEALCCMRIILGTDPHLHASRSPIILGSLVIIILYFP